MYLSGWDVWCIGWFLVAILILNTVWYVGNHFLETYSWSFYGNICNIFIYILIDFVKDDLECVLITISVECISSQFQWNGCSSLFHCMVYSCKMKKETFSPSCNKLFHGVPSLFYWTTLDYIICKLNTATSDYVGFAMISKLYQYLLNSSSQKITFHDILKENAS